MSHVWRFVGGCACGAAVSSGCCLAVLNLYRAEEREAPGDHEEIGRYGLPATGAEVHSYDSYRLSYDRAKRTPRWVAEHLTDRKLRGKAERKHCRFRPDPNIPECFSAVNDDYLGSGWSRGHMAPAGDNKQSERSMSESFYLSNIVPQNYENNAGFWNRLEIYCRELTRRFQDVWIVSGPLTLPEEEEEGGRKMVSYQVIGKHNVAVPTHLFKAILVRNNSNNNNQDVNNNMAVGSDQSSSSSSSSPFLALGAFIVPNRPIGFDRPLTDFQISLEELERQSGLTFFPRLPRTSGNRTSRPAGRHPDNMADATAAPEKGASSRVVGLSPEHGGLGDGLTADLCEVDGCRLIGLKEFTLYIAGRKVGGARSLAKLERFMSDLRAQDIQPDDYLTNLYLRRKKELEDQTRPDGKTLP